MSNHGNTPAAWTAVALASLAFVVGGVGLMMLNWYVFWVGVALAPIGIVAGLVMGKLGMHNSPGHNTH